MMKLNETLEVKPQSNQRADVRTVEKQLVESNALWSLAGPSCIALTLIAYYLRPEATTSLYPILSLVGMYCCQKWKFRGLAVSLGVLASLICYRFIQLPLEEKLWEFSLYLAFSLGFIATAFSAEETDLSAQLETTAPHETIQKIAILEEEKAILAAQAGQLRQEIEEKRLVLDNKQTLVASQEKLIDMSRDQMAADQQLVEKLRRELHAQAQKLIANEEKAEEVIKAQKVEQAILQEVHKKEIYLIRQELNETVAAKDKLQNEKSLMQLQLTSQLMEIKQQLEAAQKERQKLYEANSKQEALHQELNYSLQQARQAAVESSHQIFDMQNKNHNLEVQIGQLQSLLREAESEREKNKNQDAPSICEPVLQINQKETTELFQNARRFEGLYKQMRSQFEDKSALLDQTRKELFQVQEKLEALKKESKELGHFAVSPAEKAFEKHILRMEKEMMQEIAILIRDCEALENLVTHLLS